MIRILLVIVAAASLAACATTPPNFMTSQARDGVFVRNVDVTWSAAEAKRVEKNMQKKSYQDVQPRLQAAVATAFKNSPSGSQAIDLKIEIERYYETSSVQADVSVVRVSDGQVLGVYKNVTGIHAQGGGLLGLVVEAALKTDYLGIIVNSFSQTMRARFDGV